MVALNNLAVARLIKKRFCDPRNHSRLENIS